MSKIFQNKDLISVIAQYADFEQKFVLAKLFGATKNIFRFYDFYSNDYQTKCMIDLFEKVDEEGELWRIASASMGGELTDYYIENEILPYLSSSEEEQDDYNRYMNNMHRQSEISFKMTMLFCITFPCLYVRTIIKYLDCYYTTLSIPYSPSMNLTTIEHLLDEQYNINVYDEIFELYKTAIDDGMEEEFCHKCGCFGHETCSSTCFLYNPIHCEIFIKEMVEHAVNELTTEVEKRIDVEIKEQLKLHGQCVKCKQNQKHGKCVEQCCFKCCDSHNCKVHSAKRLKNEQMQLKNEQDAKRRRGYSCHSDLKWSDARR